MQIKCHYCLNETKRLFVNISIRVKSQRGVEFRRWANNVLKQYILQGYAVNQNRTKQLGEVIRVMKRTENALDSKLVLSVIERYNEALELLDAYDHQTLTRPKGNKATYILTYEECMEVIRSMRFDAESDLFGREKDDSFKGSIGNIYQSFGNVDVYASLEEKAANLLYRSFATRAFIRSENRSMYISYSSLSSSGLAASTRAASSLLRGMILTL